MTETIKIRGLKELEKAMLSLEPKIAKKHLTASVRKGARLVGEDARDRVQKRTGQLRRNIVWFKMRERDSRHSVSFGVKWRSTRNKSPDDPKNARHGHIIEFGSRYQPAQPFLRPAFEANKRRAIGVIARFLGARIQQEARKR